jgi:hypothetical protein
VDDVTASMSEDSQAMAFERCCRALLLAYPAAYRAERADEMLGTLLATNPGKAWPMPRDICALLLGGLRTRSDQNRRLATLTNLRLAGLLGCSLYLTTVAATYVSQGLWSQYPWQPLAAVALSWVAAVSPFLAGRRVAVALSALAVVADFTCFKYWEGDNRQQLVATVVPLLLLMLLSRGATRPPRHWLWLPGLVVGTTVLAQLLATPPTPYVSQPVGLWAVHTPLAIVLIAVAVLWTAIDARIAVGVAAAYFGVQFLTTFQPADELVARVPGASQALLLQVHHGVAQHLEIIAAPAPQTWFAASPMDWRLTWGFGWEWLAPAVPLALLALWRVRRQAVL